jgi:hypothetical protein
MNKDGHDLRSSIVTIIFVVIVIYKSHETCVVFDHMCINNGGRNGGECIVSTI